MKYYLCLIGYFDDADKILSHCLEKNIYQYHEVTLQKGAAPSIEKGDTLILVYQKKVIAYGLAEEKISHSRGFSAEWMAVPVDKWERLDTGECLPLPYGVFWHMLAGNKQSIVKQIDELWANDLITQIIWRNKSLRETDNPAIFLHLVTIAALFNRDYISIPAVQRGKVWNATRVEVLWDSIMRGIPIGSFVIKPGNQKWELLDGQQRVNAISLGFQDFHGLEELNRAESILWIDLMPNKENEINKNSNRKYFFRVTTLAHPWGYHFSSNETRNDPLDSQEKRDAVNLLSTNGLKWTPGKSRRPHPKDLWPFDSCFPVPFSILRQYFEKKPDGDFDGFWQDCKSVDAYCKSNWFLFLDAKKRNEVQSTLNDSWNEIREAIKKVSTTIIVVQNSSLIEDEYVGLYFSRMNKAGIVPNEEEIRYSLLKSKVPDLKYIDHIAENRMMPARMANIAMSSYLTQKKGKWISEVDHEDVTGLAQDNCFSDYIYHRLELLRDKIENWIIYRPQDNQIGIPKILYSKMAKTGRGELYKLLLLFAEKWDNLESAKLVALISLIDWFGNEAMVSYGYNKFLKDIRPDQADWNVAISQWLFEAVSCYNHLIIPPPSALFFPKNDFKNKEDISSFYKNPAHVDALNNIWGWTTDSGRAVLLYACRVYLNIEFGDYDPSEAVWSEENRPWDYDHIVPQNWKKNGRASGTYHDEVKDLIDSIGNIAPISFEKNRQKKDDPPRECGYLKEFNEQIAITPSDYDCFDDSLKRERALEKDDDLTSVLASITTKRFSKLYDSWYNTLKIDSLFEYYDSRRLLFQEIEKRLKTVISAEIIIKVFVSYKRQYECQTNADWAHQWLAIGIDMGKEKEIFPAVAVGRSNKGFHVEVGLRRHPQQTSLDGKDYWYKDGLISFSKSYPADHNIDELADELYNILIGLYNEISHSHDEQPQ